MICGLMHTRSDAWCIGYTARVAVQWVDKLLVYAHACTDRTLDILDQIRQEYPGKLCIFVDPDPNWPEMDHRQYMLEWARQLKATHIAIIDSDEALTANLFPDIRKMVEATPRGKILSLPGIQLWEGVHQYRIDGRFTARFSLAFVDDLMYAWRPRGVGKFQHHCRPPQPLTEGFCPTVEGGIFHFQFVCPRALRFKQLRYQMIEVLKWPERGIANIARAYSWWTNGNPKITATPYEWWMLPPSDKLIHLGDADASWYELEVLTMIDQHGKEKFYGLNDFGLGVLK